MERFYGDTAVGLVGDFSPEEYEDFAKSVKRDEKQAGSTWLYWFVILFANNISLLGKISKQARKYLDYLHQHNVQLIVEKRTIRRMKIGDEGETSKY